MAAQFNITRIYDTFYENVIPFIGIGLHEVKILLIPSKYLVPFKSDSILCVFIIRWNGIVLQIVILIFTDLNGIELMKLHFYKIIIKILQYHLAEAFQSVLVFLNMCILIGEQHQQILLVLFNSIYFFQ